MSVTRSLLNEFRPLFQLLDDPFYAADPFSVATRQRQDRDQSNALQSIFSESQSTVRSPHVHMNEEDNRYVVEAEIPGVPKENLDISIGDNGRSLTIKGSTFASSEEPAPATQGQAQTGELQSGAAGETQVTESTEGQAQPQRRWTSHSSFARTIWLPRPVDAGRVAAKLDHGVLTLEIPKLQATTQRITVA